MNNYFDIYKNKVQGLVDYITKYNLKSLVLGISGGIDSTVTAVIARTACDKAGIPLIGRSLPTHTNQSSEQETARLVGKCFCNDFKEVEFEEIVDEFTYFMEDREHYVDSSIALGNIKARLRMIYLYHLAWASGGIVLDTDNLTEHNMGFWTIHGDEGDVGVLGDLWKTEVFEFAKWLTEIYAEDAFRANEILEDKAAEEELLTKYRAIKMSLELTPTDGNGTAPDLEQYGAPSFDIVDEILSGTINSRDIPTYDCSEVVLNRYNKSAFKRSHRPFIINKFGKPTNNKGEELW